MTEPPPSPDDTFDLIFLPRFEKEIARRVFPDWTGTEAMVEQQVRLLPELAAANSYDRRYATDLLFKHRPDLRHGPTSSSVPTSCSNTVPIFGPSLNG
jgi:hypothetical protein